MGFLSTQDGEAVKPSNALDVRAGYVDVTFLDEVTTAQSGSWTVVNGAKTLTIEIYGTSSSRSISFKATGQSGTPRTLMGVNVSTFTTATSTTETGEIWQFDVTGLTSVIMDLTAVAGGNVTVNGRAVA